VGIDNCRIVLGRGRNRGCETSQEEVSKVGLLTCPILIFFRISTHSARTSSIALLGGTRLSEATRC